MQPESRLLTAEKLEGALKRFTYSLLNEASMNLRNIILQNLFRVIGVLKLRHPTLKARTNIVEFFNRELEEQLESTSEPYRKSLNLKSLLNIGVCLNGVVNRLHEQGQLGRCHQQLLEIQHC